MVAWANNIAERYESCTGPCHQCIFVRKSITIPFKNKRRIASNGMIFVIRSGLYEVQDKDSFVLDHKEETTTSRLRTTWHGSREDVT